MPTSFYDIHSGPQEKTNDDDDDDDKPLFYSLSKNKVPLAILSLVPMHTLPWQMVFYHLPRQCMHPMRQPLVQNRSVPDEAAFSLKPLCVFHRNQLS